MQNAVAVSSEVVQGHDLPPAQLPELPFCPRAAPRGSSCHPLPGSKGSAAVESLPNSWRGGKVPDGVLSRLSGALPSPSSCLRGWLGSSCKDLLFFRFFIPRSKRQHWCGGTRMSPIVPLRWAGSSGLSPWQCFGEEQSPYPSPQYFSPFCPLTAPGPGRGCGTGPEPGGDPGWRVPGPAGVRDRGLGTGRKGRWGGGEENPLCFCHPLFRN